MAPSFIEAQRTVGQALDLFETSPAAQGPWPLEVNPGGGNLALAGGTYIATLPAGWTVDAALANRLSGAWMATPIKPGWANFASNVVNLGAGRYQIDLSATFTPAAGPPRQFNFQMS